jgi:hypothetical protein
VEQAHQNLHRAGPGWLSGLRKSPGLGGTGRQNGNHGKRQQRTAEGSNHYSPIEKMAV